MHGDIIIHHPSRPFGTILISDLSPEAQALLEAAIAWSTQDHTHQDLTLKLCDAAEKFTASVKVKP